MEGLYVAAIVPYDRRGRIDDGMVRTLIERNLDEGAAGFFVEGSSGECFLLSPEERIHLFEVFAEYKNRCTLFAHVGSLGTEEAVRYAKAAKQMGYQRVAATPPTYFGYSTRAIAFYYDDIASAIGEGVYYYNIPMNTHRMLDLGDADTRAMFSSGSIAGVKHTNLDLYEMDRLRAINTDLKLFGGFENLMIAFLTMGCDGFIGSTFNFTLPHFTAIMNAFESGDLETARTLQIRANNMMEVIMREGLFPSIKHVLNSRGLTVGDVRRPFLPLSEDSAARVDAAVEANMLG